MIFHAVADNPLKRICQNHMESDVAKILTKTKLRSNSFKIKVGQKIVLNEARVPNVLGGTKAVNLLGRYAIIKHTPSRDGTGFKLCHQRSKYSASLFIEDVLYQMIVAITLRPQKIDALIWLQMTLKIETDKQVAIILMIQYYAQTANTNSLVAIPHKHSIKPFIDTNDPDSKCIWNSSVIIAYCDTLIFLHSRVIRYRSIATMQSHYFEAPDIKYVGVYRAVLEITS